MTRTLRLVVCTVVGAFALGFGGTAFAAYDPSLLVAGTNHTVSGSGPVVIGVGQGENDDATFRIDILSPLGYRVTLGQAPGTTLGELSGVVKVGALGGARVNIEGTVRTDNPANYVTNQCSPGVHEAVWILEFTLAGNQIRVPMYVDRITSGAEAAFASARMRVCLASPYIPPAQGGAQSGASLIVAAFSVRGVFANPSARGSYPWNGVFVPWTVNTGTPNAAGVVQSTSIVRLPVQIAITARRVKRGARRFARITVCLTEAGQAIRGVTVNVNAGSSPRRLRRVARGRTNARGCYTTTRRFRTRNYYARADADVPARSLGTSGCTPTLAPRCTETTLSPAFDRVSRAVRVRRGR